MSSALPDAKDKSWFRLPEKIGAEDHLVGLSLCVFYVSWLLRTERVLGFSRDEGFYFHASSQYQRWFEALFTQGTQMAFQQSFIDPIWTANHEHPGLMKSLFALSHYYFYDRWHTFQDQSTTYRFPGMVMAGLALWIIYMWGARAWSRRAGICAAVLFALMPRIFYHAHLACFDMPITTMWVLCLYVYWRSIGRGWGWAVLLGLVFGLALDTKHNAWILPFVIIPHAIFTNRRAISGKGVVGLPTSVLGMLIIGPAVFIALWPWLWNDTMPRIEEWMKFHLNHEYYNMEYLGVNYFSAPSPRSYMPVMIIATVPTITLALFVLGVFERLKNGLKRIIGSAPRDFAQTDLLLALGFLAAVGPWILSSRTPIFGGTKHWFPAYPMLALFAGRGFEVVAKKFEAFFADKPERLKFALAGLWASVIAAPLVLTIHSHPFGLSAYTTIVGGSAGAADLGLNRQFWGFTSENANTEYLAKNAPQNATVFIHDTSWDSWMRMIDENRIRRDIRGVASPTESQLALVHHELHMAEIDHHIWIAYGTAAPVYVVAHDGVPIVSIYRRPGI
jgi:4-amino-4-deoxy-L-arabinose transferase-like glycosyltransferase